MHKLETSLSVKGRYDLIVFFVGGNDLPTNNTDLPTGNTEILARNNSELAVAGSEVALRVIVIAVPPRTDIHDQAKALNGLLESNNDRRWLHRGISPSIHSVEKHTYHQKRHTLRAMDQQWIPLYDKTSSASENLLPPDRQTRSPSNIRVPSGSLHLPALSHVSCLQVSDFTILLLRYCLMVLVPIVHSATTVLS